MKRNSVLKFSAIACLVAAPLATYGIFRNSGNDVSITNPPGIVAPNQSKVKAFAILPLTGRAGSLGNQLKNGLLLFEKDAKNSDVAVTVQDSQGNPSTAVSILSQASVQSKPTVLVSAMSQVSGAVIPKAEAENYFTMLTMTSSEKIIQGHSKVQRINPTASNIAEPIAAYARSKFKKVAVVHSKEEYGVSVEKKFRSIFVGGDRTISEVMTYESGQKDLRTPLQKVINSKPEAVFIVGFGPEYIATFKSLRELGYKGQILADTTIGDSAIMKAIGDASENVVFTATELELTDLRTDKARNFAAKYKQQFNQYPWYGAALAYDTLNILQDINKKNKPLSQATFQSMGSWDGTVSKIAFLPNGECSISLITIRHKGGKNVPE